jgi:hypothetical protein
LFDETLPRRGFLLRWSIVVSTISEMPREFLWVSFRYCVSVGLLRDVAIGFPREQLEIVSIGIVYGSSWVPLWTFPVAGVTGGNTARSERCRVCSWSSFLRLQRNMIYFLGCGTGCLWLTVIVSNLYIDRGLLDYLAQPVRGHLLSCRAWT